MQCSVMRGVDSCSQGSFWRSGRWIKYASPLTNRQVSPSPERNQRLLPTTKPELWELSFVDISTPLHSASHYNCNTDSLTSLTTIKGRMKDFWMRREEATVPSPANTMTQHSISYEFVRSTHAAKARCDLEGANEQKSFSKYECNQHSPYT